MPVERPLSVNRRSSDDSPTPLVCVGADFESEFPGSSALATECYGNVIRAGHLLVELHDTQTRDDYQLSASARQVLAVVDGAGAALEPTEIAQRLLITT